MLDRGVARHSFAGGRLAVLAVAAAATAAAVAAAADHAHTHHVGGRSWVEDPRADTTRMGSGWI